MLFTREAFILFQIALKPEKYMHKCERKNESHVERARESEPVNFLNKILFLVLQVQGITSDWSILS